MPEEFPSFRYRPFAMEDGTFVQSSEPCSGCGRDRGWRYDLAIYSVHDDLRACPWCIADGSFARKFDATFLEDNSLQRAGLPSDVMNEMLTRTPGYSCWQYEDWIACCGDACEFHGDAPVKELQALDDAGLQRLASASGFPLDVLREQLPDYEPRGSPAFYKFVCRHCGAVHYNGDCD